MSAQNTHGCCADKACNDTTCMQLPAGNTCSDCINFFHCEVFYAHKPGDTYCDFFPRRFKERKAISKATGGAA